MSSSGKRFLVGLFGAVGGLHAATRLVFGETICGWVLLILAVLFGAVAALPIGTYWMKRYQVWPFCPRDNQARRYQIFFACIGYSVLIAFWSNRLVHVSPPQVVEARLVATSSGNFRSHDDGTFERSDAEHGFRVSIAGFDAGIVGTNYKLKIVKGVLGFDVAIAANKSL